MNLLVLKTSVALGMCFCVYSFPRFGEDDDAFLTVPEIIAKYEYPIETHHVTTDDGYILTMYRIPHSRNNYTVSDKPVLALHGIFNCAVAFLTVGVDHALGYILADEGYDVWLGNSRGCPGSQNHTTLDAGIDAKYWDFSWHEMGVFDLPAMIDHILEVTGQSSLYFVGYSQGTTVFYVMATTHPQYKNKVRVNFSMAPAVYFQHPHNTILLLEVLYREVKYLTERFNVYKIPSNDGVFYKTVSSFCRTTGNLCHNVQSKTFRFVHSDMQEDAMKLLRGHSPVSVATKQVMHFLQVMRSGYFQRYNFDKDNCRIYGRRTSPSYNLSEVTSPTYLFYSDSDFLINRNDVNRLCKDLGRACKEKILISDRNFEHGDYITGKKVRKLVFDKIISLIGQH